MLERIEALDPQLNAFCLVAGDEAMASAAASEIRWGRGAPGRPARRRADVDQGPRADQGLADAAGQPDGRSRPGLGRRRAGDGAAARGRRRADRQDDDAGVRVQGRDELGAHRDHPQPVGPDAHVRRFVGRHGGRRGRRPGPAEHRDRRRRVGAHPRRVLRQRRAQAELRAGAAVPDVAVRHRVAPRAAHDERRRQRAADERPQAARRPGLDGAAARRPRLPGRARRRRRRVAHRLLADARLRRRAPRGRRRRRRRGDRAGRRRGHRRGRRPRLRRPAGDHDRAVVHRLVGAVEHAERGAAGRRRPRLRRPGRARVAPQQPRRAAAQRPPQSSSAP